jgi:hypothetical protein
VLARVEPAEAESGAAVECGPAELSVPADAAGGAGLVARTVLVSAIDLWARIVSVGNGGWYGGIPAEAGAAARASTRARQFERSGRTRQVGFRLNLSHTRLKCLEIKDLFYSSEAYLTTANLWNATSVEAPR